MRRGPSEPVCVLDVPHVLYEQKLMFNVSYQKTALFYTTILVPDIELPTVT